MIGKLYVLSLFYMMCVAWISDSLQTVIYAMFDVVSSNAQPLGGPLQPDEQPTTFTSTLTVPTVVLCTLTRDARVGNVACSETAAGHGPACTVDFSV
jgi:hypothetical protein